ncbi:putative mitochondrial transport protein FSF1 [Venturia nashicola]|nr:putative mitochondrial transport protein FSF1 [Venturia nashicola]
MSASLPGSRDLPASQYDLSTYWGRVRHAANLSDPSTLFTSSTGLEHAKSLIVDYKKGKIAEMTPELWTAKKTIDSTLHPDTGEPVLLPFRMSAFVFSNLVVTAGMLTPGLGTAGTAGWQVANQSLNVAINFSNANKATPLSTGKIVQSYFMAVGASCGVALGLKALVPRLKEIKHGIPVYPTESVAARAKREAANEPLQPLGKSKKAATLAVGETAISRVLNATPIMVLPPLILVRLQETAWLQQRPRMVTPVNLGLIFATSIFALPLALAAFPQRQAVQASSLEKEFWDQGGEGGLVEFNRGI